MRRIACSCPPFAISCPRLVVPMAAWWEASHLMSEVGGPHGGLCMPHPDRDVPGPARQPGLCRGLLQRLPPASSRLRRHAVRPPCCSWVWRIERRLGSWRWQPPELALVVQERACGRCSHGPCVSELGCATAPRVSYVCRCVPQSSPPPHPSAPSLLFFVSSSSSYPVLHTPVLLAHAVSDDPRLPFVYFLNMVRHIRRTQVLAAPSARPMVSSLALCVSWSAAVWMSLGNGHTIHVLDHRATAQTWRPLLRRRATCSSAAAWTWTPVCLGGDDVLSGRQAGTPVLPGLRPCDGDRVAACVGFIPLEAFVDAATRGRQGGFAGTAALFRLSESAACGASAHGASPFAPLVLLTTDGGRGLRAVVARLAAANPSLDHAPSLASLSLVAPRHEGAVAAALGEPSLVVAGASEERFVRFEDPSNPSPPKNVRSNAVLVVWQCRQATA